MERRGKMGEVKGDRGESNTTSVYGSACREFGISLMKLPRLRNSNARANAQRRESRENHALSNETWRRRKPRYLANIWGPCIREVRTSAPWDYDRAAARGSAYLSLEAFACFFVYFSQNEPYNTLRFRRILRLWDPPSCFCVTVRLLCGRHAEERASATSSGLGAANFPCANRATLFHDAEAVLGSVETVSAVVSTTEHRSLVKENPSPSALFPHSISFFFLLSSLGIDCLNLRI